MKHLKQYSPLQQVFILVFVIMIFYRFMTALPLFPDEILGFAFSKIIKVICGLSFSLGAILIYTRHKKAKHGSGH
ncbi:hypothetical protein PZB74_22550 [Porifericola rhodea]|uniref:hypothetical protein n=1 Tax=Porifericola rhodea TaxID=930972 RepID=UPI00266638B5|nr:hypothetical protein [Porifericola rhodea]WKN31730.1 hypothetical protein PZB74_22550 [Porifericola rhodea]